MRNVAAVAAMAVAASTASTTAIGQTASNPPVGGEADGRDHALPSVVVTATRAPADLLGTPASVTVVGAAALRERRIARFGDALAEVPGVHLQGVAFGAGFPASGQAALSLRGIPRTPRTLVLIDGQPINNALSGGINVAAVPIEALGRVEVVRGPYSALYGGYAMGGVVHFVSATADEPLDEIRLGAGGLGQRGASLVHRRRYDSGLGISLAAGYREGDGYPDSDYVVKQAAAGTGGTPVTGARRTATPAGVDAWWVGVKGARPWRQDGGQLTLDVSPAPATRLAAGLGWASYRVGYRPFESFLQNSLGQTVSAGPVILDGSGVRLALAETDFLTPTPSGERDLRLFTRLEHRIGGDTTLTANVGTLRHAFTFAMPTNGAAGYESGPGELTEQPNRRVDLDVSLRSAVSERWVLVGGIGAGRSSLDRSTTRLSYWRDASTRLDVPREGRGTLNGRAAFLQSEHFLDGGLSAYLGARYDRFDTSGDVIQRTAPAFEQSYGRRSFDSVSPKVALVWQAHPSLALRTSLGAGFRPPTLLDLYSRTAAPTAAAGVVSVNEPSPDLRPERVRSFEIGADVAIRGGPGGSLTLYRQRLEDLIYRRRLSPTLTRTENAAEAEVDGVEANVEWPLGWRGLTAAGTLTHQFKYRITRNDAVPASVGMNLTDVAQTIGTLSLHYRSKAWSGLLAYRRTSHVFGSGDDLNRNATQGVFGSYDAHGVARARVAWRASPSLELSLSVDNLTDREYFVFYRQPRRSAYVEAAWRF